MDTWIQSILRHSDSEKSFFDFISKVEQSCFAGMQKALIDGETVKAVGLAYEARAYQTIKRTYKAQVKNQINTLEKTEE